MSYKSSRGGFGNPVGRPRKEAPMVKIPTSLPPDLLEQVEAEAERLAAQSGTDVSRGDVMRRAVNQYFDHQPDAGKSILEFKGVIYGGVAQCTQMTVAGATVEAPFETPRGCYALLVVGNSMATDDGISIPDGHFGVFCPQSAPPPGALVHVEWPDDSGDGHCVTFKKYLPQRDGSAIFRPLNKDGSHKDIRREAGTYEIRGVFIRSFEPQDGNAH